MKVLFLDPCHSELDFGLIEMGFEIEHDNRSSQEQILQKINDYTGIVIRSRFKLEKDFLSKCSSIKFIVRFGAGLENIDVDFATSMGIKLIAAPEGNANAVGEHALAMLLSLFRNLNRADSQVRNGHWIREGNRGFELSGKTVGIIGYGNMGKAFSRVLRGFDVNVIYFDIKDDVQDQNAKAVSLEELFEQTEILSIHTPLTPLTRDMVDGDFINRFKKNIFVINTARGPILKIKDLSQNIKTGKVLGACLDVLEYEKTSFENLFSFDKIPEEFDYLIKSDKCVLSPHIAGWTFESNSKMSHVIIEKLKKHF